MMHLGTTRSRPPDGRIAACELIVKLIASWFVQIMS